MPANNSYKEGRVNEEVKKELSEIIKNVKDPRIPSMPTIVKVKVAGDLSHATVYVSFLEEYDPVEVMKGLKAATGFMRKKLGDNLKMRIVPALSFVLDTSIEHGAKIEQILKDINSKKTNND